MSRRHSSQCHGALSQSPVRPAHPNAIGVRTAAQSDPCHPHARFPANPAARCRRPARRARRPGPGAGIRHAAGVRRRRRSRSTTLASLRAGYRFDNGTKLAVDVFNLFDRKASDIDCFYASRLQGEPAAGVADTHFHPRSVRVTLTVPF